MIEFLWENQRRSGEAVDGSGADKEWTTSTRQRIAGESGQLVLLMVEVIERQRGQ